MRPFRADRATATPAVAPNGVVGDSGPERLLPARAVTIWALLRSPVWLLPDQHQPPHRAPDTRADVNASLGPRFASHLPFATSGRRTAFGGLVR